LRKSKILLFCLIMLLGTLITVHATPVSVSPLKIHYIDVGQADCIFIQTPNHHNLLIDAGKNEDADKILSYLHNQKIKLIDILVATHPHEDHIGSMAAIINKYNVGQLYMPKISTNTETFLNLLKTIKAKGLTINTAQAGCFLNIDPSLVIEMLAPNNSKYEDLNDYSAVIKIVYNQTSFLFTGDASRVSEKEMLKLKYDLKADVLKVGHHGSNTSTTGRFLQAVSPKYAVISVGANNDYGHPGQYTLSRLMNAGIKVYRTDLNGTVTAISDGQNISFKVEK
jgi:competence protein ComEC